MTSRRLASAALLAARALVAEGRRREAASVLSEAEIAGVNDDALGLLDGVIRDSIANRLNAERGNALRRTPNFSIPAATGGRPVTADGRTSFHLFIRHHTVDSASGSGGNAAGEHDAYIARLGAVPDLPDQREGDVGDSGPAGSGAILEDRYIDRPGAVASVGNAKAMWTNISDQQIEREDFWGRVEAYEQGGRPDALIFSPADDPAFWERVASREDCPDEIREALERKSKTREIMAGARAAELLDWLRAVDGWTDATARVREGRRGGVAQHRINGEISKELNEARRIAAMSKLANVFEVMNLRYVLVMHQPDARNDPRNWHYHLIYYDRPTEKARTGCGISSGRAASPTRAAIAARATTPRQKTEPGLRRAARKSCAHESPPSSTSSLKTPAPIGALIRDDTKQWGSSESRRGTSARKIRRSNAPGSPPLGDMTTR